MTSNLAIFHSDESAYQDQFHTTMEELVDVAKASRPKLLVLYHQRPGPNAAGLEFIKARYDGRVVAANDLDVFE